MKSQQKLDFMNGISSFVRTTTIKLLQFSPLILIVFVAWGDRFLPSPLNSWSYSTRTQINGILKNSFADDAIKNDSYNNKKSDRLVEEIENKSRR